MPRAISPAGEREAGPSKISSPTPRPTTPFARRRMNISRRRSAPSRCSRRAAPRPMTSTWPCPPSPTRGSKRWCAPTGTSAFASSSPPPWPTWSSSKPCPASSISFPPTCGGRSRRCNPRRPRACSTSRSGPSAGGMAAPTGASAWRCRRPFPTRPPTSSSTVARGFRASTVSASTRISRNPRCRRWRASAAGARASWPASPITASSARDSWARTRSGSPTMTCACSPTRAPPSPTIREAISAWARASLPCGRCSIGGSRWGSAPTALCARTTRTSSRPCASPPWSARSASPTPPSAGSTRRRCGGSPPPAPRACWVRLKTWGPSRLAPRPIWSCCALALSSCGRSRIPSRLSCTRRRGPAWTLCWWAAR